MTPVTRALPFGLAFTLLLGATAEPAFAQDHLDIETFKPAPDVDGSVLSVYGAGTRAVGELSVTLFGSYGRRPLTIEDGATGKNLGDLVGAVGTGQLMAVIGLAEQLDLGLAIPVHRIAAGSEFAVAPPPNVTAAAVPSTKIAFGDVRLVPRVTVIEHAGGSGLDLGIAASLWLPTGDDKVHAGEPFRVEPRLALAYTLAKCLFAANAGYLLRQRAEVLGTRVDDLLPLGVGADIHIAGGLSLLAEFGTQLNVLSKKFTKNDAPAEALGGLRFRSHGVLAQVGAGPGLVRGIGTPAFRLFASVTITGTAIKLGHDGDHDGILDAADRCPKQPGHKGGFADSDGCPDPDNDGDGVLDASDGCPQNAEDRDGFEDDDGCLDADNDHDGVPDRADACPGEAEDRDGFEDDNGCPDPDNDGDGTPDGVDRCPREAGLAADSGCPAKIEPPAAESAPLAQVTEGAIELKEVVFFGHGNAQLQERSLALMESVAKVLSEHPEIELLVVEGHTDATGDEKYNEQLSRERAKAVQAALIQHGIAAERLRAEGFGPNKPIAPNDTKGDRAKNRRVELRIERRTK